MTDEINFERILGVVLGAVARSMSGDVFENLCASIEREAATMNSKERDLLIGYICKLRSDPQPDPSPRSSFRIIDGGAA